MWEERTLAFALGDLPVTTMQKSGLRLAVAWLGHDALTATCAPGSACAPREPALLLVDVPSKVAGAAAARAATGATLLAAVRAALAERAFLAQPLAARSAADEDGDGAPTRPCPPATPDAASLPLRLTIYRLLYGLQLPPPPSGQDFFATKRGGGGAAAAAAAAAPCSASAPSSAAASIDAAQPPLLWHAAPVAFVHESDTIDDVAAVLASVAAAPLPSPDTLKGYGLSPGALVAGSLCCRALLVAEPVPDWEPVAVGCTPSAAGEADGDLADAGSSIGGTARALASCLGVDADLFHCGGGSGDSCEAARGAAPLQWCAVAVGRSPLAAAATAAAAAARASRSAAAWRR